ncbi:cupin domain-containing protein [Amphritea sp.]|uniref:cupin domain-containing protein n=1 Tax=Amphritea sp. TaxID=1872502 RepID=UPI003A8FEDD8
MNQVQVINFKTTTEQPQVSAVASERRVEGAPEQVLWNKFIDSSESLLSGTWSSDVGTWKVDYNDRNEFCYLLEGTMALIREDGFRTELTAGDAFVIPAGFVGCWQVTAPMKKHYVIHKVQA